MHLLWIVWIYMADHSCACTPHTDPLQAFLQKKMYIFQTTENLVKPTSLFDLQPFLNAECRATMHPVIFEMAGVRDTGNPFIPPSVPPAIQPSNRPGLVSREILAGSSFLTLTRPLVKDSSTPPGVTHARTHTATYIKPQHYLSL